MFTEKEIRAPNGIVTLVVLFIVQVASIGLIFTVGRVGVVIGISTILLSAQIFIGWFGFFMVNPNEARVL